MKKWHKITENTLNELPKDSTFILFDDKATSGVSIYEAMLFDDGKVGCPATVEEYDLTRFSHWRKMIKLPGRI